MSFHIQQSRDTIPVVILITAAFLSHVTADFILEAQVLAYSNPTHFASAFNASDFGQCCDRSDSPPTCTVPSFCDNSFTFCFREAGRRDINTAEDDGSNCPYGRSTTDLIQRNNDNLTFTVGETFPGEVPNPVTAFGQIWPGHIQLAIQIVDLDFGDTDDDDVDIFLIDTNLTSGIDFSAPTTYNGMNGFGRIELSFRLNCTENYYGPDCATFCMERNDDQGHYTCDSDGSFVCLQGYQDAVTNCTTDADAASQAVVGGVVGGVIALLVLAIIILTVVILYSRRRNSTDTSATDKANSWDHSVDNSGDSRPIPGENLTYSGEVGCHVPPPEKADTGLAEEHEFVNPLYSETTPEHSLHSETTSESENLYTYPAHLLTNTSPPNPTELFDDAFYATPDKPKFCEHYYAEIHSDIVPDPGGFRN